MTVKEKLKCILVRAASDDYSLATRIEVERLADYLIANGVTVLPEGAIILTKKEIAALNEYQLKHFIGSEPNEK